MKFSKKTLRPKGWTQLEIARLATLARKGTNAIDISAKLGRHVGSVRRMARAMKLVLHKPIKSD